MKSKLLLNTILTISAFSVWQSTAQEVTPPAAQPGFQQRLNQIIGRATDSTKEAEPVFSIKYHGGHTQELVDELKKIVKPTPNIMVSSGLEDVNVPAFDFQNVTLTELLLALNALHTEGKSGTWQQIPQTKIWVFNPQQTVFGYGMPGGFIPQTLPPQGVPPKSKPTTRIFPIGQFLTVLKVEDITTAVQTAWQVMNDESGTTPEIKYHKDAELLLVLGDPSQTRVVEEVLASIERGQKAKDGARGVKAPEAPAEKKL